MHTVLRHSAPSFPSWCLSATGRSLLHHLCSRAKFTGVFMPCYVPEGVILPFMATGLPIFFYKLHHDLSPDAVDLSAQMDAADGALPLVIVINYFGYPNDYRHISHIVHAHDGILLEDCAHCVGVAAGAAHADLHLLSFNKLLPCVDGAALYSRRPSIQFPGGHGDILPKEAIDAYTKHLLLNAAISREQSLAKARELIRDTTQEYERYYKIIREDFTLRHIRKETMLMVQSSDGWLLAARKHRIAARWYYALKPDRDSIMACSLSPHVAPFAVPIVVKNRDELRERLLRIGIIASTCVDKWDHIPKKDSRYEIERHFRDHHLLLPCNDRMTHADIVNATQCLMETA